MIGILLGRYLAPLLGYQPYYPEFTSDWQAACGKMRGVWTQRWAADPEAGKRARRVWGVGGEGDGGLDGEGGDVGKGDGEGVRARARVKEVRMEDE